MVIGQVPGLTEVVINHEVDGMNTLVNVMMGIFVVAAGISPVLHLQEAADIQRPAITFIWDNMTENMNAHIVDIHLHLQVLVPVINLLQVFTGTVN